MLLFRLGHWQLSLWQWSPHEAAPYQDDALSRHEVRRRDYDWPSTQTDRLIAQQLWPVQADGDLRKQWMMLHGHAIES